MIIIIKHFNRYLNVPRSFQYKLKMFVTHIKTLIYTFKLTIMLSLLQRVRYPFFGVWNYTKITIKINIL